MRYRPVERAHAAAKAVALGAPIVASVARRRRARTVERAYERLVERYDRRSVPSEPLEQLLAARSGQRLREFRALARPPRVLFVGTVLAQDSAGILEGLARVAEVEAFTQADGRYGQTTPDGALSFDLAAPLGRRLLELLGRAQADGRPFDVVIGQLWAGYFDVEALREAQLRHGVLVVNIAMDDRHTFSARRFGMTLGTQGLIPALDLAATAAPEAVGWYLAEGVPALFFPEASDPQLFSPAAGEEKRYEVCFVGARYGIRQEIVGRLERAGIQVEAYGSGWPAGHIPTADVARLFAESKIVLGVGTVGHSRSLLALKLRDFDGPMSGSCYATHDNPDLRLVYDVGKEIVVFSDEDEAVEQIRGLLVDDERREDIARRGRRRAVAEHTWDKRFGDLLAILAGGSAAVPRREDVRSA
jgi:spore maturation protein CgeB